MSRKLVATCAAAFVLLVAAGEAMAANACYRVSDPDSGLALNLFVRLQTRSAGTLVPANEGNVAAPAQTLFEVDGYSSARTGLVGNGRQIVEMSPITGTVLIVAGEGAQMSLLRNFGRGEQTTIGFSVLSCGSATAASTPATWVCRGTTTIAGLAPANARPLRLTKVNPAVTPQCREFGLRSN